MERGYIVLFESEIEKIEEMPIGPELTTLSDSERVFLRTLYKVRLKKEIDKPTNRLYDVSIYLKDGCMKLIGFLSKDSKTIIEY
jgi:hypothetical protein